ncbi:phage tail terminator family protein [Paenibacillus zanthoxyli]|uniref:phage tail terminator family protein n=1 Tax=Paenibacillus zanthoxyli TaxID=369399 RepID=UPI0012EB4522|nr:hypothetical protein [Paenibacillus zanthoxyli]
MMSVQHLRSCITGALEQRFVDIPVISNDDPSQTPGFRLFLVSAAYDRQREDRYAAVYRFGVRYEGVPVSEAEVMADALRDALTLVEGDGVSYRSVRQTWTAGAAGEAALFTAEYSLYLQSERPETVRMGQFTEEGRLK